MTHPVNINFKSLKEKQRAIHDSLPDELRLRIHRALSWLHRSELAEDDDATFIFLWIAFNAAYAKEIGEYTFDNDERSAFCEYFTRIIALDTDNRIYDAIWERFSSSIRIFMDNYYVFQPFWKYHNQVEGYEDWEERFKASKARFNAATGKRQTDLILGTLFDRLYVLRNQLVHGGASWNSSVNRDQIRDGKAILEFLVPAFIDLMMDNPSENWGKPYYPVVG